MAENDTAPRELDILEMPLEGIAAYWLSVKKVLGEKVSRKNLARALEEEAERTAEPFIKHMLLLAAAEFPEDQMLALAAAKRDTVLRDIRLKLDLMRDAILSIAAGENPRQLLVTMMTRFANPPISEQKATALAVETVRTVQAAPPETNAGDVLGGVDHRGPADKLMVKLLFLAYWARRDARQNLPAFVAKGGRYFREALSLVTDGFEPPYVKRRVEDQARELLEEARLKMDMTAQLARTLRADGCTYEKLYLAVRSYLL